MNFMDSLWTFFIGISWSLPMLMLFLTCGIILTIKTRFIQFKAPFLIYKTYYKNKEKNTKTSSSNMLSVWEALSSALAGTVGTGNIAGVTLALMYGGAGAVFWLWISAFLGMATKYVEIRLSIENRILMPDGSFRGGPMIYIEKCLSRNWRPLAFSFAVFGAAASFGIGNLAQCKEIVDAASGMFSLSPAVIGFCLTAIAAYIISGGVKRMGKITSFLVPIMSILYILASTWVISVNIGKLPSVLMDIFSQAFKSDSVLGGISGYSVMLAMKQGVARGVFSNEAGLGSSPMAHAASACEKSEDQALLGVFEVFISSIVFCTLTALAVLLSGTLDYCSPNLAGGDIAANSFDTFIPFGIGGMIIRLSLIFFAFSSLVSWSYYGRCCVDYIFGYSESAGNIYKFLFALCCTFGALMPAELCWEISDTLNAFMAMPNLTALILISLKKDIAVINKLAN